MKSVTGGSSSKSIVYKGKVVSIYKLAQLSGLPRTPMYTVHKKGVTDGEAIIAAVKNKLHECDGRYVNLKELCAIKNVDYRAVCRRLHSGGTLEQALSYNGLDRRGDNTIPKLTGSQILYVYEKLFKKESTQGKLARELGVNQSTISDVWRHNSWAWLTSPLRHQLELELQEQQSNH